MSTEPAPATTTITVKSVPVEAWTLANRARKATGESMGVFIGRAVTQLAEQTLAMPTTFPPPGLPEPAESFPTVKPLKPLNPLNDLALLAEVAIRVAEAQQRPMSRAVARLLNQRLRERLGG